MKFIKPTLLSLAMLAATNSGGVYANESEENVDQLRQQIKMLTQRLDKLENQSKQVLESPTPAKKPAHKYI